MSASSLSLPIFLRINFLISYLIVTDSQNTFDWHTQRALLNDKKAGAGCTSRAFKHPGRDVTAPDVWPSILIDYTYDSELDNADGVPLAFRRSSMFPEGNHISLVPSHAFLHNMSPPLPREELLQHIIIFYIWLAEGHLQDLTATCYAGQLTQSSPYI